MCDIIAFPANKPQVLLPVEREIVRRGYNKWGLSRKAVKDYRMNYIEKEKKKIPEDFLKSFADVYVEQITITQEQYIFFYEYAKKMPYKMNEIICYAIFLYYQKLLNRSRSPSL